LSLQDLEKRDDAIKILPETWHATYYHWMENIRDWCVSRQLWWGHQIPAWHCKKCAHITVSRSDVTQCGQCGSSEVEQDSDVLDTWFSSGLWPFSTLGWPEKTPALKTFYPTSVMETGFDILFFWVARMIMMGLHLNDGKVPFKRVYLHAMVRDEKGQKMSKTKGNVIDPLDIIRDYGADAFRFTLTAMAGQGRDIKLSLDRIEGYKTFCNKLWNASRYVLMRLGAVQDGDVSRVEAADFATVAGVTGGKPLTDWVQESFSKMHPVNRWILSRLQHTTIAVEKGLEEYRLNDAASEIYHFVWNDYCDWYIEFSKELLASHPERVAETQICLLHVLEQTLALAHPLIPFVTEEIYSYLPLRTGVKKGDALMLKTFPTAVAALIDETALRDIAVWQEAITALRAFRGENNIPPKARPAVTFEGNEVEKGIGFIRALAQLDSLTRETGALKKNPTTGQILAKHATFFVQLEGLVDFSGELKRLEKERSQIVADIEFVQQKLSKESFTAKAPPALVQ
ncbi:MAG TPA: class I tRNA ligase family protein, partial [Oligoflexia bacterium]|nr:class I tRNA ligase family protein [Oligoflexia bacterium]